MHVHSHCVAHNVLFRHVSVAVAVVFCVSSLLPLWSEGLCREIRLTVNICMDRVPKQKQKMAVVEGWSLVEVRL